jgi:hypothetical protein
MNRWRVGEDRGSKEMDGYPLTAMFLPDTCMTTFSQVIANTTVGNEGLHDGYPASAR